MPPAELSPRQKRFVDEYLVDLNGKAAAIRAGYAAGQSAEVQASRLLSDAKIKAAIAAAGAKTAERTAITKDWVVREAVDTYKQARELDLPAAARGTLELLAKLHGHIIERRDVRVIKGINDLSDEELDAVIASGADAAGVVDGTRH